MTQLSILSSKEDTMDDKVIEIIKKDIERCEKHTTNAKQHHFTIYSSIELNNNLKSVTSCASPKI